MVEGAVGDKLKELEERLKEAESRIEALIARAVAAPINDVVETELAEE